MKIAAILVVAVFTSAIQAQQPSAPTPEEQHAAMMKRGDAGMGFSQETTTHQFLLLKDGGAIQVSANNPKDDATHDHIRMHLSHVAEMFSAGDFDVPMFIHDTTPPGVPTMKKLHNEIHYRYQETETGGKIVISTANPKALKAVHEFLRFQISEHRTGDSTEITDMARDLLNAMAERHKAMLAGDTDVVERLTADEYVQTDISGYVQDKSAWLNEYFRPLAALIKAGKFRWDTYEEKDVQTRTLGDTAIVIGSMTLKGTGAKPSGHTWVESPETTFAGTLRFTRVWVKRDGSWRLAALQNAMIPTSTGK